MNEEVLQRIRESLNHDVSRRGALSGAAGGVFVVLDGMQTAAAVRRKKRRHKRSANQTSGHACAPGDGCRDGEMIVQFSEPMKDPNITVEDLNALGFNAMRAMRYFTRLYETNQTPSLSINNLPIAGNLSQGWPDKWLSYKVVSKYYYTAESLPGEPLQDGDAERPKSLVVCNNTDINQTGTVVLGASYVYEVVNKWGFTAGMKYAVKGKFLSFFEAGTEFSFSVTYGQDYKKGTTETESRSAAITVPPHSILRADLSAQVIHTRVNVRMPIKLDGWVVARYDSPIRGSNFHAARIDQFCTPKKGLRAGWDETIPELSRQTFKDAKTFVIKYSKVKTLDPNDTQACDRFFG